MRRVSVIASFRRWSDPGVALRARPALLLGGVVVLGCHRTAMPSSAHDAAPDHDAPLADASSQADGNGADAPVASDGGGQDVFAADVAAPDVAAPDVAADGPAFPAQC